MNSPVAPQSTRAETDFFSAVSVVLIPTFNLNDVGFFSVAAMTNFRGRDLSHFSQQVRTEGVTNGNVSISDVFEEKVMNGRASIGDVFERKVADGSVSISNVFERRVTDRRASICNLLRQGLGFCMS